MYSIASLLSKVRKEEINYFQLLVLFVLQIFRDISLAYSAPTVVITRMRLWNQIYSKSFMNNNKENSILVSH